MQTVQQAFSRVNIDIATKLSLQFTVQQCSASLVQVLIWGNSVVYTTLGMNVLLTSHPAVLPLTVRFISSSSLSNSLQVALPSSLAPSVLPTFFLAGLQISKCSSSTNYYHAIIDHTTAVVSNSHLSYSYSSTASTCVSFLTVLHLFVSQALLLSQEIYSSFQETSFSTLNGVSNSVQVLPVLSDWPGSSGLVFSGFSGLGVGDTHIRYSLYLSSSPTASNKFRHLVRPEAQTKVKAFSVAFANYALMPCPVYTQSGNCVSQCAANYYPTPCGICRPYCHNYTAKCLQCVASKAFCVTCSVQFQFNGGCVDSCPQATYPDSILICQNCQSNCLACSNKLACISCNVNFYLHQGHCLSQCPSDFYQDQGICRPCSPTLCIYLNSISLKYADLQLIPYSDLSLEVELSGQASDPFGLLQISHDFQLIRTSLDQSRVTGVLRSRAVLKDQPIKVCLKFNKSVVGLARPISKTVYGNCKNFTFTQLGHSLNPNAKTLFEGYQRLQTSAHSIPRPVLGMAVWSMHCLQLSSSLSYINLTLPPHLKAGIGILSIGNLINSRVGYQPGRLLVEEDNILIGLLIQLAMLLIGISVNAVIQLGKSRWQIGEQWQSLGWRVCDYCHQYFMMYLYIFTGLLIRGQNFPDSTSATVSICLIAGLNVEMVTYNLYRFWDFTGLVNLTPDDEGFNLLLVKFSHQLADIRYNEKQEIEFSFFRPIRDPQFYHILSPVKKTLVLLSLTLLAADFRAQLAVLILIQTLELARIIYLRPFKTLFRNVSRGVMQGMLLATFCLLVGLGEYLQKVSGMILGSTGLYDSLGWTLLIFTFTYSLYYIGWQIYSFVKTVQVSSVEDVKQARLELIKSKEMSYSENDSSLYPPLKSSSLQSSGRLRQIQVEFERVRVSGRRNEQEVEIDRCIELRMDKPRIYRRNNTVRVKNYVKTFCLSELKSSVIKAQIQALLAGHHSFEVRTFTKVKQSELLEGQRIALLASSQRVRVGESQVRSLEREGLLKWFPLSLHLLRKIQLLTKP